MIKKVIFCFFCFVLIINVYSKVIMPLPELGKPFWLRVDSGFIFISDHYSVSVYELKTSKLITKLGKNGEGPEEFEYLPKITFSSRYVILNDINKAVFYSKEFKYCGEVKTNLFVDRMEALEDNFLIKTSQVIDNKSCLVFSFYNTKFEKPVDLVIIKEDLQAYKYLNFPHPVCRACENKAFIAQPHKGFYIDVFDNHGKKLYQIEKNVEKVKSEEKHRSLILDSILSVIGRAKFERKRKQGVFKKPMTEYMPAINNFWVKDDRIYVKTYDITDKEEKFIILDLNGNLLKTIFLPITYRENLAFDNNVFYYLEDNEDEDMWVLHALEL